MYQVIISNKAEKTLSKLPTTVYARIIAILMELANNPRPTGCKKLKGRDAWRIRVGDYRIIYEIEDDQLIIWILDINHRKDAYKKK